MEFKVSMGGGSTATKTIITDDLDRNDEDGANLKPLLDFLLANGASYRNSYQKVRPFKATKNGSECILDGGPSMATVREHFDFRGDFQFDLPFGGCIWDRRNNTFLCFG